MRRSKPKPRHVAGFVGNYLPALTRQVLREEIIMSDTVHVRRCDDGLAVHVGAGKIICTELRVKAISHFVTPHEVLGRGGASLALTDTQLLRLVAEWLRYNVQGVAKYEQQQAGWSFHCERMK